MLKSTAIQTRTRSFGGSLISIALLGGLVALGSLFATPQRAQAFACDTDAECIAENANNPCVGVVCSGPGGECGNAGTAGVECRAAVSICDVAETCTGTSDACPQDLAAPATTECRPAATICDVAEFCNGVGPACPQDLAAPATTECRPAVGECDEAEFCNGEGPTCPQDLAKPSTTECRPAMGDCDVAEFCEGTANFCPQDLAAPATTECRPSADACDAAEFCNGVGPACPADGVEPATTECRAVAGDCDVAESCDGVSAACPADGVLPATTECRAAVDVCDAAESCDGVSVACPADGFEPNTTECRPDAGECDVAEFCDGAGACPTDIVVAANTPCGDASSGECDAADTCDGAGACQPNNVADGSACGSPGDECTNPDACASGTCESGGFVAAATPCGDGSSGECDAADSCDGAGACQPNNAADGSACGDLGDECTNADACASGVCQDNGFVAAATPCGDPSSGECDTADSCDGAGMCLANNEPAGTACGDGTQGVCTDPDTCDGEGVCLVNNLDCAFVTDSRLCPFDENPDKGMCVDDVTGDSSGEACDLAAPDCQTPNTVCEQTSQFTLVFTADEDNSPAFELTEGNSPRGFFYNLLYDGPFPAMLTFRVPYPYVTVGEMPVRVFDAAPRDADECFMPQTEVAQSNIQLSIDDWIDGGFSNLDVICDEVCGPNGSGFCSFDVEVDDPGSGLAYVNVHLDYGLEGVGVDANPCDDGFVDRYGQGPEDTSFGGGFFAALVDGTTDVGIDNCTDYGFSHTDGVDTFSDSVQNQNIFVPEPGHMQLLVSGISGLVLLNRMRRRRS